LVFRKPERPARHRKLGLAQALRAGLRGDIPPTLKLRVDKFSGGKNGETSACPQAGGNRG